MRFYAAKQTMQRRTKRAYPEHEVRDRWLVSYTDVLTILLTLFVAIAAQNLKGRIPLRPLDVPPPDAQQQRQHPLFEVERKLQQRGLDLRLDERGLTISLPQAVLFPSGEARIIPEAVPIISDIVEAISAIPNKVVLVGHADSVPIHNLRFQSNWELSAARSLSLLELLTTQYGIPESRLSVQSYGSTSPRSSNETESGRAENRRVEILIVEDKAPP